MSSSKPLILGLSGVARSGKDSFATLLIEHLASLGQPAARWAFADQLKRELEPVIWAKYGLSVWSQVSAEKAIFRDDLVAHGRLRRTESNGTYWVKQIDASVRAGLAAGVHQIITDCRYATHEEDEADWIKSLGGKVVYIERILIDGSSILEPANEEERLNTFRVKAQADLVVTLPTFLENPLDNLRPIVQATWSQLTQST